MEIPLGNSKIINSANLNSFVPLKLKIPPEFWDPSQPHSTASPVWCHPPALLWPSACCAPHEAPILDSWVYREEKNHVETIISWLIMLISTFFDMYASICLIYLCNEECRTPAILLATNLPPSESMNYCLAIGIPWSMGDDHPQLNIIQSGRLITYNQVVRETVESASTTFVALPIYTKLPGKGLKPLPVLTHHLHVSRD